MDASTVFNGVTAASGVVIGASASVIAWLQYRADVEAQPLEFGFHHAYGIQHPGVWIGITCRAPRAYIHCVDFPDGYAVGDFGPQLNSLLEDGVSGPGPVSQGDVRFVRVNSIGDDGYFYLDVLASVDRRGRRRTITSPPLTDGLTKESS